MEPALLFLLCRIACYFVIARFFIVLDIILTKSLSWASLDISDMPRASRLVELVAPNHAALIDSMRP